jgi:hypothetical protein
VSLVDNRYHIPTGGELLNGGYAEPGFKSMLPPSEGWCAITHEGKVFGQMFPEGVFDVIQLYYPKINTHMILEPIIFGVGMSPETCAEFTYMIYMGDGDADTVKEMRAKRADEFSVSYEPFDTAEIPATLMDELEDGAARPPEEERGRPGPTFQIKPGAQMPQIPQMPQMPTVQMPDVGAIIRNALRNIPNVTLPSVANADRQAEAPAAEPEAEKMRVEALPPETEVTIEHLKGNITVHAWENSYLDYSEVKGTVGVGQDGDVTHVKIDASGDYSLGVPRDVSRISLNFVNGSASMSGIASSLRISGVNGDTSIVAAGIPEEAELSVSLVKGNVDVSIPGDSACIISASSLSGGEISCDLPLENEERTRTQLRGVLNDGTARVILNTVKGDISIGAVKAEQGSGEESVEVASSTHIKEMIRIMIDEENPETPLSDQDIRLQLEEKGLEIKARTVAKYRTELGIPLSQKRRDASVSKDEKVEDKDDQEVVGDE